MPLRDIIHYTPALGVIWIISLVLLVLLFLFFAMQSSALHRKGGEETSERMGNALGIVGILMCVTALAWAVALIIYMRNARNIWADASSIYASRNNILTSWFNNVTGDGAKNPISSAEPADRDLCYGDQYQQQAGPKSFEGYQKLIAAYADKGVDQYYLLAPPATLGGIPTVSPPVRDTLQNQQMLTLAYYRMLYCVKSYMTDILSGKNWGESGNLRFLSAAQPKLMKGEPCIAGQSVPDTIACLTDGWLKKDQHCSAPNPCYDALQQTLTAQCLLYDDHVYGTQFTNIGPQGALQSFGLTGYLVA